MSANGGGVILELNDIHTFYGSIHALKGISLEVREGEIVTLLGANGAGKSTTLRSINGLQRPRQGSIRLRTGTSPRRLRMRSSSAASRSRRKVVVCSRGCQ